MITTVLEHNSVLRPLYEMEEKGVEVTILPCDSLGMIAYGDFEKKSGRIQKRLSVPMDQI